MDFEKVASYFSTSNPAFSQAYVLRIRPLFSPAETSFTALSFRSFRNNFLFRYMPSQKAITIKITCCVPRHVLRRALYFFHRNNLRTRRTRQVDFARYNNKSKAPLLLSSLLFFKFPGSHPRFHFPHSTWQTSKLSTGSFTIA